ncbi:flagellar hook-length control protein FliK [Desulfuromonas sp.]|uniref:flagellar hook-length control protein FliK n=1 Tax=Desulfuromonas sp. TaxID=892 RepID=UPI0025B85CC1|nr:flagellar hook-length control protein FliK [Desulfuromonas sp.]
MHIVPMQMDEMFSPVATARQGVPTGGDISAFARLLGQGEAFSAQPAPQGDAGGLSTGKARAFLDRLMARGEVPAGFHPGTEGVPASFEGEQFSVFGKDPEADAASEQETIHALLHEGGGEQARPEAPEALLGTQALAAVLPERAIEQPVRPSELSGAEGRSPAEAPRAPLSDSGRGILDPAGADAAMQAKAPGSPALPATGPVQERTVSPVSVQGPENTTPGPVPGEGQRGFGDAALRSAEPLLSPVATASGESSTPSAPQPAAATSAEGMVPPVRQSMQQDPVSAQAAVRPLPQLNVANVSQASAAEPVAAIPVAPADKGVLRGGSQEPVASRRNGAGGETRAAFSDARFGEILGGRSAATPAPVPEPGTANMAAFSAESEVSASPTDRPSLTGVEPEIATGIKDASAPQNLAIPASGAASGRATEGVEAAAKTAPAVSSEPSAAQTAEAKVLDQVIDRLSVNPGERTSRISMRLHPEELGQLKLDLTMEKDGLRAHFQAQSAEVQEILERHLPRLREALQQQGLALEEVRVSVDSGADGGRGSSQDPRQPWSAPRTAATAASWQGEGDGGEDQPRQITAATEGGLSLRI